MVLFRLVCSKFFLIHSLSVQQLCWCYIFPPGYYDKYFIPSEEEWKKFWDKMDNIRVWNWIEDYDCPDFVFDDGSSWNLKIELGNKKVASSGSNFYPGDNIEEVVDDQSETFKKFLDALQSLTGFKFRT